jgi:plasmid stability protein
MPAVTVRNLPEATHRALKVRAALHGRSTEAEIREILEAAVRPSIGLGGQLAAIGRKLRITPVQARRDRKPVEAARFE